MSTSLSNERISQVIMGIIWSSFIHPHTYILNFSYQSLVNNGYIGNNMNEYNILQWMLQFHSFIKKALVNQAGNCPKKLNVTIRLKSSNSILKIFSFQEICLLVIKQGHLWSKNLINCNNNNLEKNGLTKRRNKLGLSCAKLRLKLRLS